jgi:hypothetical protein
VTRHEVQLRAHSGADRHRTGWTECAPLLVRGQRLLTEVLGELRHLMLFPLLALDTDNDGVFINETFRDYCEQLRIKFTRCRPYRKNDQASASRRMAPSCAA